MAKRSQKLLYDKQAEILKALSHPLRIAILDYLKDGEQCVCDIAKKVGSERSNVSRHLALMVNAGVLSYKKQGLKVIYKLQMPCTSKFFSCLQACIKQQAKETSKLLRAI
ncbi:MAG: winged helix-turn-helix transcriptional regulator [Sedimentisphaerales bacterium]|nr:winged helix-turn-helix transcriptional regulator [Sedimentisphaerales bacterium]